jgi:hypothetical protein
MLQACHQEGDLSESLRRREKVMIVFSTEDQRSETKEFTISNWRSKSLRQYPQKKSLLLFKRPTLKKFHAQNLESVKTVRPFMGHFLRHRVRA